MSLIFKIILGISLWIQKLKSERGIEERDSKTAHLTSEIHV